MAPTAHNEGACWANLHQTFSSRALRAQSPSFQKFGLPGSVFWAVSSFLAPLRVEKPCVLPLFFIIAETPQQAKGSQKNVASAHLRAARADVAESCHKNHWKKFARVSPFIMPSKVPCFRQSPPPPLRPSRLEEKTSKKRKKQSPRSKNIYIYIYI